MMDHLHKLDAKATYISNNLTAPKLYWQIAFPSRIANLTEDLKPHPV